VVLLGGLFLARPLLVLALTRLAQVPGTLGRAATGLGAALRPGLGRRVVATVLGLGAPALAVVATSPPATAAALAPAPGALPLGAQHPDSSTAVAHRSTPATSGDGLRPAGTARETVVVRAGDTLWDIARRHLPRSASSADVARAWPRWYAVNRAVIGPDPALLRPGTRLRSPDRRPAGTPASTHQRPPATRTDPGAVARSLDPDRR
jgi:nucleoid-associated protein YgaU